MKEYGFEKNKNLVCGENIHQSATLYNAEFQVGYDIFGVDLSYNDILNVTMAVDIVAEFFDVPACSIVKMQAPTGVALGKDIEEAFEKALDCDPINALGSVVATSNTITKNTAEKIATIAPEVVVAPNFDELAIDLLKKTSKLVKLNTKLEEYKNLKNDDIKVTPFGILVQEKDTQELSKNNFKILTKTKPTPEQIEDAVFAWKIAKHAKSHAIVVAKDFKTSAIVQGQNDMLFAIEHALNKSCENSKDSVIACDLPLQSKLNIQDIVQGRIALVIQPAGHNNDKEIIKEADKYKLAMIKTGVTHQKG
ncbi:MAG: hypothetical protein MJ229_05435 [bacterium]|nr:hypothetical protein [bacterium]